MKNISDKQNEEKFEYNGIYRAIVLATEDPRDIGRVKVHVPGVFPDGMEMGLYPWAKPALGLYNSGGENKIDPANITSKNKSLENNTLDESINSLGTGGIFTVPNKGNTVFVWFDQGNHMYPYYFAMEPKEGDWLKQKLNIKDKINSKVADIKSFSDKFKPELGVTGATGKDWGDGAYINSRQNISSSGETIGNSTGTGALGSERIKEGKYKPTKVNNINEDIDGLDSKNMSKIVDRSRTNKPSLDIKPLFDKEDGVIERKIVNTEKDIDFEENPHVYSKNWSVDDVVDNERNINRYVTSIMTEGGTTILIDNREGQENYYFIHKGYMKNVDQHGSVKQYVGTNKVGTDVERCDNELGVEGDNKIHVLGNFVTYVKGNKLTQVDKNLQIDVNDSCGIRMKKGDFDIILNGEQSSDRDDNNDSEREEGKDKQFGDMNIDIQNGHLDVHVNKNCNVHVEGNVNLQVDGSMKQTINKDYHLHVKGNMTTKIEGDSKLTVGGNVEEKVSGKQKQEIGGGLFITAKTDITGDTKIKGKTDISATLNVGATISSGGSINASGGLSTGGSANVGGDVTTSAGNSLNTHKHVHNWFWSHGGGSGSKETTPPTKGASASISSPTSPTSPQPGDNEGGSPTIASRENKNRGSDKDKK
jgi:hypothetical protein